MWSRPRDGSAICCARTPDDAFGHDKGAPATYKLEMQLGQSREAHGLTVNNVAQRYQLDMTVNFTLTDLATGKVATTGTVTSAISYDSAAQPYAGIAARQDTQDRQAEDVASKIQLQLDAWMARGAPRNRPPAPAARQPSKRQRLEDPGPVILSRRPDIERFLASPDPQVRVAVLYGRDLGVVRERATALAKKATARPDDPFDVALISDGDLDNDPARLVDELMAISMMGGRRLVRLRLGSEKASLDKLAAGALERHAAGEFNPDAFFLVEAGNLGRDSALRRAAEKAPAAAAIPCYEDEIGDLARLTREALAAEKLGLNAEALDLFIRRLPHERGVVRQEIERLILYLESRQRRGGHGRGPDRVPGGRTRSFPRRRGPGRLWRQAGRRPVGPAPRRGRGRGRSGGRARHQHVLRPPPPHRHPAPGRGGTGRGGQVGRASVFWKNEREFLRQARAWDLSQLDEIQPEVLAADRACKTTGSPDQLIAERLALAIAGRARRLGL